MQQKTTRREFLKTGGKIAGTVILSSLSGACVRASGKPGVGSAEKTAPSARRDGFTVFSPAQIGTMKVKNRLVRSATMVAAAHEGRPTEEYIRIHRELAAGGVGVIITGFMIPTRSDARYGRQIFVYEDSHIPGLEQVAQAVHDADNDCRLVAQIGHSGETVSPSGIKWPFVWKKKGRALSIDEVNAIVDDVADAVWRAKTAGFDGVELHGAHAYLISSFLSPLTNQRIDKYGGSLENRVQIVRAIMDASRKRHLYFLQWMLRRHHAGEDRVLRAGWVTQLK
jgi:2,4-dienoyl-CoA reductase-like NADH-dependent reductase (Old Yellow Enzyme family)